MNPRPVELDWLARVGHPRLVLLLLVGVALGMVGGIFWLSAAVVGRDVETAERWDALIGALVAVFAAPGVIAFAVFERTFD